MLYQKVAGYGYASTGDTVYQLNGQYSALSGTFFQSYRYRDDKSEKELKIYGDGELLYSVKMSGGIRPVDFYVDLTGVLELKICYNEWGGASVKAALGNCGLWA